MSRQSREAREFSGFFVSFKSRMQDVENIWNKKESTIALNDIKYDTGRVTFTNTEEGFIRSDRVFGKQSQWWVGCWAGALISWWTIRAFNMASIRWFCASSVFILVRKLLTLSRRSTLFLCEASFARIYGNQMMEKSLCLYSTFSFYIQVCLFSNLLQCFVYILIFLVILLSFLRHGIDYIVKMENFTINFNSTVS